MSATGREPGPVVEAPEEQAEPMPPENGSAGNGQGPGKPSDITSAFINAVVSAARQQERSSTDRQVPAALTLGWYLAALAHPGQVTQTPAAVLGATTGLGALTEGQMIEFCQSHVTVAFGQLREVVGKATALPDDELQELSDCIDSAQDDARRKAAAVVDAKVLSALSAADFRLGKAYGIGAALMNLTAPPAQPAELASHLTNARIAPIIAAIDDLTSALPPHAGHSVRESLREWQKSVETRSRVAPDASETWLQLARQGELWRAVLAGEKSGRDLLEIEDYVDAADRLSKRMRGVAIRLVRQFPEVCVAIVALFAIGVALIALTDSGAAIAAGAGTILASLGLTWRGVGRSLGALAGKLERPLWGAELDVAITRAITLLERERGRDVTKERRKVATDLGGIAEPAAH
jgi:hypothetical protein